MQFHPGEIPLAELGKLARDWFAAWSARDFDAVRQCTIPRPKTCGRTWSCAVEWRPQGVPTEPLQPIALAGPDHQPGVYRSDPLAWT